MNKIIRTIVWVSLTTLAISGTALVGILYFFHIQDLKQNDPKYQLKEICYHPKADRSIPISFLSELLDLSKKNLHALSLKEAKEKLIQSPLIEKASLTKKLPDTLLVKVKPRKPIAILKDLTDSLIDRKGFVIPSHPFHQAETLPELYLGLFDQDPTAKITWGDQISPPEFTLALNLLEAISDRHIKGIDLSNTFSSRYAEREILVLLETPLQTATLRQLLRLNPETYLQGIKNYRQLQPYLVRQAIFDLSKEVSTKEFQVDLRFDKLAFFSKVSDDAL